jgi:cytoskeletal protein RodZ
MFVVWLTVSVMTMFIVFASSTSALLSETRRISPTTGTATNTKLRNNMQSDEDSDNGENREITPSLSSSSSSSSPSSSLFDDDLTDRFKYKVHALMGAFDPPDGTNDHERQDGNILNAMLTFPTRYTFHVVGKISTTTTPATATPATTTTTPRNTAGTNETLQNISYADIVKRVVYDTTGDDDISCDAIQRGKNFLKVKCEATVQSVTMINNIYNELDRIDGTVMRF